MRGFTSGKGLIFKQLINCLNVIFLFHSFIGPTVKGGPKGVGSDRKKREKMREGKSRKWRRLRRGSREGSNVKGRWYRREEEIGWEREGRMEGGESEKGEVLREKRRYRKAGEKDGHVCGRGGGEFGVQKSCCLKEFVFIQVFVKRSLVLYF